MLLLADLLWVEEQLENPAALRDRVGDCFLYRHNSIYARVRDACLGRGCLFAAGVRSFGVAFHSTHRVYGLGPGRRVIYYVATRKELQDFDIKYVTPDLLADALAVGCPLRESLLVLSDTAFGFNFTDQAVLRSLLCESFADAVELLASALANNPIHVLCFRMNSFVRIESRLASALADAVTLLGLGEVAKFATLAVLLAKIRDAPLDFDSGHQLASLVVNLKVSASDRTFLVILSRMLSKWSRDSTRASCRQLFPSLNLEDQFSALKDSMSLGGNELLELGVLDAIRSFLSAATMSLRNASHGST